MRYIGNKENILNTIYDILLKNSVTGNSFFDFFSGTTSVAQFFKKQGYQVVSSDLLYLSFCLQKAYIENNDEPLFEKLLQYLPPIHCSLLFPTSLEKIISYLNNITPVVGFIYENYTPEGTINLNRPRMYFTAENGKKIDAIRMQIEEWKNNKLILESEYYILLSCLIESVSFYANISGVYSAFNKVWDPRAVKPFVLRPINIINNHKKNCVHNTTRLDLVSKISVDILYLDPPYNERQYLPNYHLVETIAKYDFPKIKGITGMREYNTEKSSFCNAVTALNDLEYIASNANCKYLILSYSSEGIMKKDDILSILTKYGEVKMEQFINLRFKSHSKGLSSSKKHIFEQVFMVKK